MNIWVKTLFVFLFFSLIFLPKNIEARSGCCSHHGGVCGCRCCDGSSLSATCAPYYPSCGSTTTIIKTVQPTSTPRPTLIPTRIPTIVPTLKPTTLPTSTPTEIVISKTPTIINIEPTVVVPLKSTNSSSSDGSIGGLIVLGGLGFGGYKLVKKFKNKQ